MKACEHLLLIGLCFVSVFVLEVENEECEFRVVTDSEVAVSRCRYEGGKRCQNIL